MYSIRQNKVPVVYRVAAYLRVELSAKVTRDFGCTYLEHNLKRRQLIFIIGVENCLHAYSDPSHEHAQTTKNKLQLLTAHVTS